VPLEERHTFGVDLVVEGLVVQGADNVHVG
jgi:hypothetical protein